MIHRRGNWWIREIKSRFRSQKLSKQKKNKFESKRFRSAAAFQPPLFSKSKCVLLRGFCRRARMRVRRIDRAFASRSGLCSFETNTRSIIVACTRRREKSFATELQTKKTKKKASLFCVPRTKTSRVFGRPFLRWTRRSRSKFAKPISRNVVASSFRSWRPTLSRSCGWTGR